MQTIEDLLNAYQVPLAPIGHHHQGNGWRSVDCPFCSPGWGKYRLGFHQESGRANCWLCGKTDAVAALALLCRVPIAVAVRLYRDLPRSRTLPFTPFSTGSLALPTAGDLLPAHQQYLRGRGFDPDKIQQVWGIKGIGLALKLQWRILIPIHDPYGRVVSWTTRSIQEDADTRYISASPEEEAVHHKHLIYGHHLARHSIGVCEGPISAWGIGPGAGATLGVGYTPQQMAIIASFPLRAIIFDATPDAQKRAHKLCRDLSCAPGVTENVELESGEDTACCDPAEIQEIRDRYLN